MAVKLDLYRIFCEVAEEESISDAAKSLYIYQSAVSQSIRQLEEQLQVRLFSRQPRGVTLTAEGRMLFDLSLIHISIPTITIFILFSLYVMVGTGLFYRVRRDFACLLYTSRCV